MYQVLLHRRERERERVGTWLRKRQEHANLEAAEGPSYVAGGY